jgi:Tol biopolymer transport system component
MSPDGRPAANRFLEARLYRFATASWETVTGPMGSYMVTSPDGQDVAYSDFRTGELFYRSLRDSDTHTPIPGQGFAASYSPDGQWLAWGGTNGGVLVSPMPPTGATYTVTDRGQQPLWTADGSRLLYRDGRRFYEATVDGRGGPAAFQSGRPRLIAEGSFLRTLGWTHTIGRDGRLAALISAPRRRHA